jgi:hypothetical protein
LVAARHFDSQKSHHVVNIMQKKFARQGPGTFSHPFGAYGIPIQPRVAGAIMTEQELLVDCLDRLNRAGIAYYLTGSPVPCSPRALSILRDLVKDAAMKSILNMLGTLLLLLPLSTLSVSAAKPNILFIVGDDMGYADVGFHGCKDIPTPNMDALAASGVRFTSGYVSGPYCSPTRAGLLTGRYQSRFGHEFNPAGPQWFAAHRKHY